MADMKDPATGDAEDGPRRLVLDELDEQLDAGTGALVCAQEQDVGGAVAGCIEIGIGKNHFRASTRGLDRPGL